MNKLLYPLLICCAIIISSCSAATSESAGRINGTNIPLDEFIKAYRGHYTNYSLEQSRMPDMDEKQRIYKETWLNITRYVILQDYYKKYKIGTTSREVIDTLTNSIPQHILSSPKFQVQGVFDKSLYLQALLTDQPENLSPLRKHYRNDVIPIRKLRLKLVEKELISKAESKRIAKILASTADIELNVFDPQKVELRLNDNEIAEYYQANISKYLLPTYHRLGMCVIPVIPDEADLLLSKALADSILYLLQQGRAAEEIIHERKNSPGIVSLTDHGYVKSAELPLDLAELFAKLNDGECTATLADEKGWIIHQKVQSTKTLTLYRSIRIQSLPGSKTLSAPETTARNVMNLAMDSGLEIAAEEFNLDYLQSERINQDSLAFIPSDIRGKVIKKLRSAPNGSIFEPIYSVESSGWVIVEVLENQMKEHQNLDDVRPDIVSELSKIRRWEANLKQARLWIDNIGESNNPSPQAIQLQQVDANSVWDNKIITNLYYQAVKAHLDKAPPPALEHNGLLIVPVVKNLVYTRKDITPAQIRETYLRTLPDDWFTNWLDAQVKKARVSIYTTP